MTKGQTSALAADLRTLLQLADMQCSSGNWRDGFEVLRAILEGVVSKGWEMDDSSGAIGDSIQRAMIQMKKLFDDCQVGAIERSSFTFCLSIGYQPNLRTLGCESVNV